jgi:ppGpp synthetase/RelA/SpoT-type nucleotidyltranferase
MDAQDVVSRLWQEQSGVIRAFLEKRPRYEKLSEEVAYILSRQLRDRGVEYASITSRAKQLESFCEKAARKAYKRPLDESTDLAGARIVYLYLSDRAAIEEIVEREFRIVEKIDRVEKTETDRFGYGALHYLAKLGKRSSGARYDDLKDLICEIQIRTVLQDAWSMVAHHLSYKQESDVPKELRRKLNALSGLFETADDQFDRLRAERVEYRSLVRNEMSERKGVFLQREINFDNLTEFLCWRLPERGQTKAEDIADLLLELKQFGYTRLSQLDAALEKSEDALKAYEAKYPPWDMDTNETCVYSPVGAIRVALTFTDEGYFEKKESSKKRIDEFRSLVRK